MFVVWLTMFTSFDMLEANKYVTSYILRIWLKVSTQHRKCWTMGEDDALFDVHFCRLHIFCNRGKGIV